LSDRTIYSDLIPKGEADLILSVEPLEALRYVEYLGPDGRIIASSTPFVNIPDYPPLEEVLAAIRKFKGNVIVDSGALAAEAGSPRSQNMVMLGAASRFLMLGEAELREVITQLFKPRGDSLVAVNLKAFELGRAASAA
jgi:indolepyruvate ferredoxin oxidoreductase beta subunit